MANTTTDYYLQQIALSKNKSHWRCRYFAQTVESEISELRLTAWRNRGTGLGRYCNRMSNYLEKRLSHSLGRRIN